MKILLIEDDPKNAEMFLRMLRQCVSAETVHCTTGIEGVQSAKSRHFDLILIDFDLPDIYGTQVGLALYWLMRRNKIPTTPMVALTAQSRVVSEAEAARLGFSGFISKPCTEPDLIGMVEHFAQLSGKSL